MASSTRRSTGTTTRRPRPTAVSDTPAPAKAGRSIALDLDAEQRDDEYADVPPFIAVVGGRNLTFADPHEVDWEEMVTLESPHDFVRICLEGEEQSYFYEQKVPTWKLRVLFDAWKGHYGLTDNDLGGRR